MIPKFPIPAVLRLHCLSRRRRRRREKVPESPLAPGGCEKIGFSPAARPPASAAACTSLEKSAPRRSAASSSRPHFQFSTPSALEECFTAKTYTKKDSGLGEARRFANV